MTGLHPDRLLPAGEGARAIARELYEAVRALPLFCPHTHIDPWVLAEDRPFQDPYQLFVESDHYVQRILMSQGLSPAQLGLAGPAGVTAASPREAWRVFAANWHLFRGTPTRVWIEQQLVEVFGLDTPLGPDTADRLFDDLSALLATPEFRPRALFRRFGVEFLATTDAPHQPLTAHEKLQNGDWHGPVVPTFRPDAVVDLEKPDWVRSVQQLAEVADTDTSTFDGYLEALRIRRQDFIRLGATATDHGPVHPHAARAADRVVRDLYRRRLRGPVSQDEAELFRSHMLMELAQMSVDDGLVMQLHPGSTRNHDRAMFRDHGPDIGADIPHPVNFVHGLEELLNAYGNVANFTLVVFTLDETTLARELAPMAAHYPALRIGAPWWFFDSPGGMRRHRDLVTETAGFYNGAGFNDDARCFTSIPARHDMARRMDCGFLAELVAQHRLDLDEAHEIARLWTRDQAREVYLPDRT
ncbi:glucuronate isomerase [Micromonospora sp. NPDC005254]|uniref:glucuronate isomerase n=1 Tax=Micromonospora sp. NPDC005254 TaxID=3364229 RepID=UPI00369A6EBD